MRTSPFLGLNFGRPKSNRLLLILGTNYGSSATRTFRC